MYTAGLTNNYDFSVSAYDLNGVPDTTFATNGTNTFYFYNGTSDYPDSMVVQPDGKIIVGGNGGQGFSLARLMPAQAAAAGTENFAANKNKFMVYPNPVISGSKVLVDLVADTQVSLKLYDVKGVLVGLPADEKLFVAGKTEVDLNMDHLANGVYFLNITGAGKQNSIIKIVK